MRLTTLLSYSIPATILFTVACGDGGTAGEGGTAKFESATEAQRQRAVIAGGGIDGVLTYLNGSFLSLYPDDSACPTIAKAGDVITATFNCTMDDGKRVDGRLIATNVPSFLGGGNDPTKASSVEAEGYVEHGATPAESVRLDGLVVVQPDQSMTIALTAQLSGISVVTDATFEAAANEQMTAAAGSSIEVDGLGSASIHGTWSMTSETPSGALELRGADALRADFDRTVDGCTPLTVDGKAAGQICNEQE